MVGFRSSRSSQIISMISILIILSSIIIISPKFIMAQSSINASNSTILPGQLACLIEYKTSSCKQCPPNCISFKSENFVIDNKELAKKIDQIYEKSLRQISLIEAGTNQSNITSTATIYLQSLLLKNLIKIPEFQMITDIIQKTNSINSTVELGKYMHNKLDNLTNKTNYSPIAFAIINIGSKNVDLLINKDGIISKIQNYTDLSNNISQQKNWILKTISNTIMGCEISGLIGCIISPIVTSGLL